jgi:hypothetical protein
MTLYLVSVLNWRFYFASLTNLYLFTDMREAFFGGGFSDFILNSTPSTSLAANCYARSHGRSLSKVPGFDVPMVMAFAGYNDNRRSLPCGSGLKFDPNVRRSLFQNVLYGLHAFLRTMYDKFVTGVLWPGLFIFTLLQYLSLIDTRNFRGRTDRLLLQLVLQVRPRLSLQLIGVSI